MELKNPQKHEKAQRAQNPQKSSNELYVGNLGLLIFSTGSGVKNGARFNPKKQT